MVAFFAPPPFIGKSALPPLTFVADLYSSIGGTSYSFNGINIGVASANRRLIIAVHNRYTSSSSNITGVTVNGISATLIVASDPSLARNTNFYIVNVPSGTIANVTITQQFSSDMALAMWVAHDITGNTAFATGTVNNAATLTLSLNIPENGYVFAYSWNNLGTGPTWTGVTTDVGTTNLSDNRRHSAASTIRLPAQTGRTISAVWGSNNGNARLIAFSI